MKLIVGLGNIGKNYIATRHNIGFMVADYLAEQTDLTFSKQASIFKDMELAHGNQLMLLKPHTMMNLSGQAVHAVVHYYKLSSKDIWVIHDDFDLDFGKLRMRQDGSSGGHNGLKSIIEFLGEDFGRIRVGIHNNKFNNPVPATDFVLQKFSPEEQKQLPSIIHDTAHIVLDHVKEGELKDASFNLLGQQQKVTKSKSAGGVVVNPKGEILVINQDGKDWSLPKGHMNLGEDPLATAKREIYEESGISDLTLIKKLGSYQRPMIATEGGDDPTQLKTIIIFLFNTSQTELKPIDISNPEAQWVTPEKVADLLTHLKDKAFFKSVLSHLKQV